MKQTISNACGTIGALHAIANNQEKSTMGETQVHANLFETKLSCITTLRQCASQRAFTCYTNTNYSSRQRSM